jgi:hypothetical protein
MTSSSPSPHLQPSRRDLLLLLVAIACGIATGLLLWQSNLPVEQAVVAGAGAMAGALQFLDRITTKG